ncbi:MAG: hypothetical protein MRZ29_08825 [Oscillospiraceae bacterium]|nr:hypothetical protein [Oscillospiraceae bacterium]
MLGKLKLILLYASAICILLISLPAGAIYAQSDNDVDKYTTYEITPWMKKYNLTSKSQIDSKYRGGDGWQRVMCMDISPVDENCVVFGTDTSGIWTTFDGGKEWRNTSSGFDCLGVLDVKYDPVNSNIVYAVGYPGYDYNGLNGFGVYISTNGGITWSEILNNVKFKHEQYKTSVIAFKPLNENYSKVYIATYENSIMSSTDVGQSWQSEGFSDMEILGIDIVNDVTAVLTKNDGVFIQKSGAEEFKKVNINSEYVAEEDICSLVINPYDCSNMIFFTPMYICNSYDYGERIDYIQNKEGSYRPYTGLAFGNKKDDGTQPIYISRTSSPISVSYDGGRTISLAEIDNSLSFNLSESWYQSTFAVSLLNPDVIYAAAFTEISKSVDGGKTFFISSSGYSGMRITDFAFDKNDDYNYWFSFIDAGLAKSDVSGDEKYPAMYYAGSDANGIRYKGNKTVQALAMDPKNSDRIIFAIGSGGDNTILKETTDGGKTYREIEGTNGTCCKIAFHPQDPNTIYAGYYISHDNGVTFENCGYEIRSVSPVNGDVVWGVKNGVVYRSTDGGVTFRSTQIGTGGVNIKLVSDNAEEQKLYICDYSSGYKVVTKAGYTTVDCGFVCWVIAQNPKNSNHLVAGGCDSANKRPAKGLYESFDGGKNWHIVTGLTGSCDVWSLAFHPNLPRVYIGTSSGTFVYEYEKFNRYGFYFEFAQGGINLYNTKNETTTGTYVNVSYLGAGNVVNNVNFEKISLCPYEIMHIETDKNTKMFILDGISNMRSVSNSISTNYISVPEVLVNTFYGEPEGVAKNSNHLKNINIGTEWTQGIEKRNWEHKKQISDFSPTEQEYALYGKIKLPKLADGASIKSAKILVNRPAEWQDITKNKCYLYELEDGISPDINWWTGNALKLSDGNTISDTNYAYSGYLKEDNENYSKDKTALPDSYNIYLDVTDYVNSLCKNNKEYLNFKWTTQKDSLLAFRSDTSGEDMTNPVILHIEFEYGAAN